MNILTSRVWLLFASLLGSPKASAFFGLIKSGDAKRYSFNILSQDQQIKFIVGSPEGLGEELKNAILAQYSDAEIVEYENFSIEPVYFFELTTAKNSYLPLKTMDQFQDVDPIFEYRFCHF